MMLVMMVFLPILAALVCYPLCMQKSERTGLTLTITVTGVEFLLALSLLLMPGLTGAVADFCGLGLHFQAGSLRSVMALLAAFMWVMTALASPEYIDGARANAR